MLKSEPPDRGLSASYAARCTAALSNVPVRRSNSWRGHCSAHGYGVLAATQCVELSRYSVESEITMKAGHNWIIALVGFATAKALLRGHTRRRSESQVELKPEITMKT